MSIYLSHNKDSELVLPPSGEVDDRTFDTFLLETQKENHQNDGGSDGERKLDLLIVIVLGSFATIGILVNLLLMLAIKLKKRSLFLPWFVFHLITILGKLFIIHAQIIFNQKIMRHSDSGLLLCMQNLK